MRGIEASCSHRLTRERKAKKSKQVYMKRRKFSGACAEIISTQGQLF